MVASCEYVFIALGRWYVSIPFIAGQWSLPYASYLDEPPGWRVSIPFIAGQWSLPTATTATTATHASFNPLHCGAVVASHLSRFWQWFELEFQSPSLRGSGRFRGQDAAILARLLVSIPFIAGQWSLPDWIGQGRPRPRVSIPFIAGQWSLRGIGLPAVWQGGGFNPLHCGAVVASARKEAETRARAQFQSPSLRGSGRFLTLAKHDAAWLRKSQSPSLRGSGRFHRTTGKHQSGPSCFNPLHCGAVVASRSNRPIRAMAS